MSKCLRTARLLRYLTVIVATAAASVSAWAQAPSPERKPAPAAKAATANDDNPLIGGDNPTADGDNPLVGQVDPFIGEYKDATMTVRLIYVPDEEAFNGSIERAGKAYPVRAKREGDALKGQFSAGTKSFAFTATLDGPTLLFVTSGVLKKLTRQAGDGPAALPASPAPVRPGVGPPTPRPSPTVGPGGVPVLTKSLPEISLIRHAGGFTLVRPVSWQLKAGKDHSLILVPDDGAPGEAIEAFRRQTDGVESVNGPAAMQFMDNYTAHFFPQLKRTGPARPHTTLGGPGVVVLYEGKLPNGVDGRLMFYAVADGAAQVYLVHVGDTDVVARREPTIRFLFGCFGWGFGGKDEAIIDSWRSESATWTMTKDGDCFETPAAGTAPQPATAPAGDEGVWYTSENKLYVVWARRGVLVYDYAVTKGEGSAGRKTLQVTLGRDRREFVAGSRSDARVPVQPKFKSP
jgi:hypothetical protein